MRLMDAIAENRLLDGWARHLPRAPRQLGGIHHSDAELLRLDDDRVLALTVDTVADEIAAGLYREPMTAGRVAVVAGLSDLAAVGAQPLGLLLSVTLPCGDPLTAQDGVARGVAAACADSGVWVLGGDTNLGATLQITCAAAGLVSGGLPLTRVGLEPGDTLWASGLLGCGSAVAAAALFGDTGMAEHAWRPRPRLAEGQALRGIATACMDTSDGLIATLDQLARINEVALRIERSAEELLDPRAAAAAQRLGLPELGFLAAPHGEYELVFSVPHEQLERLHAAARRLEWTPLPIGQVERGFGLTFGGRAIDGARVRNLADTAGRDPAAYARALGVLLAAPS